MTHILDLVLAFLIGFCCAMGLAAWTINQMVKALPPPPKSTPRTVYVQRDNAQIMPLPCMQQGAQSADSQHQ